jgi:hypothetical protein
MVEKRWTWDRHSHPKVLQALARTAAHLEWCGLLESAAADPLTGKVLCVCAAAAVARAVLGTCTDSSSQAAAALELLERWIDDPTGERFERVCSTIFTEGELPPLDPHGVVWWALRTATSAIGNFEAGWALESACGAAEGAGFSPEQLRGVVEQELASRVIRR